MFIIFTCIIAFFFAVNIGASGAAATMGIAYGSGAIPIKRIALIICGCGIFLGAFLGGGEVVKTIGSGIVPEGIITIHLALIILSAASITLFFANLGGIPLSTSEVTVGAIVGIGIAYQTLFVNKIAIIVSFWLIIPLFAFTLAFLLNQIIKKINNRFPSLVNHKWKRLLIILVILTGFLEAFSAGMNNVANSVGPLVASGIISVDKGTLFGGMAVAFGAILLGGRVIETNGKKLTNFSLLQGGTISGIGGTLVIIASIFGMPVPMTQITTCSILGIGASDNGRKIWKKGIILRLIKTWVYSPFISLLISYSLVEIFIYSRYSHVVVIVALLLIVSLFFIKKIVIKFKDLVWRAVAGWKMQSARISLLARRLKGGEIQTAEYKENP